MKCTVKGKSILNQLSPYQPGKSSDDIKKKYGLQKVVKLASNENPFGYSPKLKQSIHTLNVDFETYPDGYTTELRHALSNKLNVGGDQLVFGSGSDEIIQMIARAFLYPGAHTVMATPTFPQYRHHALIEGAEITEVPLINGEHDLDQMLDVINDHTKVVWLCTPNNPTGVSMSKEAFDMFMEKCPQHVLVVLDEAYYEYQDVQYDVQAIDQLSDHNNLISLRTFSKAYGLAGLRMGYAITHENIARQLNIVRGPFNTSTMAQQAALIALEDQSFIKETVQTTNAIKQRFQTFLNKIGWSYDKSQTNFILVSTPVSGEDVFKYLLTHGYIVRPGEALGCPHSIRVTIGNENDMENLQQLLQTFNDQVHKETLQ